MPNLCRAQTPDLTATYHRTNAIQKVLCLCVLALSFLCTMPTWEQPTSLFGSRAEASRFGRARTLFRRANRAAKRRSYNRAIQLYKRVVRTLRRNTRRDRVGRWEAILRIAVLHVRRKDWRKARQQFEGLWRICPSPKRRYQRRLQRQFNKLKKHLSAELVLFVRPADSKVKLRYNAQVRTPRRTRPFGNARQYWFDVPEGSLEVSIRQLGFAPRVVRVTTTKPRTTQLTVTLVAHKGIAYPQAFYQAAIRLYQSNKREEAMTRLLEAKGHLTPVLRTTPAGQQLWWGIAFRQAEWLVGLNKARAARQQFARLWQTYPSRRPRLRQTMCRLHQQQRWRPPTLNPRLPCHALPKAQQTPKSFNPNFPSTITWALLATAGIGVIAGTAIFFGLTEPTRIDRDKDNPPHDSVTRTMLGNQYDAYFALTWVTLGVGIAAAVTGVCVYLLHDRKRRPPARASLKLPRTTAMAGSKRLLLSVD